VTGEIALAAFLQLASACAPGMDANRLADFAQVESGRNTLAINLNGPGGGEQHAATMDEAVTLASRLIAAGRSVDLGILQLNSQHLGEPGMPRTVAEAMEPCRNIKAGASVLAEADRAAACIYNTGRPGCSNGYPERIQAATARRVGGGPVIAAAASTPVPAAPPSDEDPLLPGWEVYVRPTPRAPKAAGAREATSVVTLTASKTEEQQSQ
jgi:type IV secretion system protein VirB1